MMQENLKGFYTEFKDEVKLLQGYIVCAINDSDFEIPNTIKTRNKYNVLHPKECVARDSVSNMFDILNYFVMDTIIEKYDNSERKMAKQNLKNVKDLNLPYPIIRVMDRVRYYKKDYPEFYQKMEETKEDIKLRIIIVNSDDGEKIRLATNLSNEEFNYEEIVELYKLRWNIELNYYYLKESLKIETITSSNDVIIEQDIYSQMLVYNLIQAFKQDAEKNMDQSKYKNEMKINMTIGFVKKHY